MHTFYQHSMEAGNFRNIIFALSLTKFPHIVGLKFCVNGTARNYEHAYCACVICSYAHSIVPLDFTYKTQVQR